MMLTPLAVGIATPEQMEQMRPRLAYFQKKPLFWLEWPSFMYPYAEAAWNSGERNLIGNVIAVTAERTYKRLDERHLQPVGPFVDKNLPEQYNYRLPGVSDEFWAIHDDNPGGCECYGWGATLPFQIIRNIIGYREDEQLDANRFRLAPALDASVFQPGRTYGIRNLASRWMRFDVEYVVGQNDKLTIRLSGTVKLAGRLTVRELNGKELAAVSVAEGKLNFAFEGRNGECYIIEWL